jgi:hypothetical protein
MNINPKIILKFTSISIVLILFVALILFLFSCDFSNEEIEEVKVYTYSPEASLDLYIKGNNYLRQGKIRKLKILLRNLLLLIQSFPKHGNLILNHYYFKMN